MASLQEILDTTTAAMTARSNFQAAQAALVTKSQESEELIPDEVAALAAAQAAYDTALETAHATVGWEAANDTYLTAAAVYDVAGAALSELVPSASF